MCPSVTEELNFKFYFILINFNFISYMWLVVTIWDSTDVNKLIFDRKGKQNKGTNEQNLK